LEEEDEWCRDLRLYINFIKDKKDFSSKGWRCMKKTPFSPTPSLSKNTHFGLSHLIYNLL